MDEYCSEIVIEDGADCLSHFEFNTDGLDANFYETATGDVVEYFWDFGDGETSDEANPDHNYDDPGMYNVCLTINTITGCTDMYCHIVEVSEGGGDCESDYEFTDIGLMVSFLKLPMVVVKTSHPIFGVSVMEHFLMMQIHRILILKQVDI